MPPLETTLEWIDYGLMAAGGLLAVTLSAVWWGRGDPLRGSPLRPSTLTPLQVWFCVVVYVLGFSFGANIAQAIAPETVKDDALKAWRGLFGADLTQIILGIACIVVARRAFPGGLRTFGLGRQPLHRDLIIGASGWLIATFVCGVMLLGIDRLLRWLDVQPPEHGVFIALRDPAIEPWMRVIAIGGAFLLAPIGEELFFRGILQTGFRKLMPPRWGSLRHRSIPIIVTAVIFGALHSGTPHHIPPLIALGVILGFLYERYGSLRAPIALHMLFNAKSLLFYLLKLWAA